MNLTESERNKYQSIWARREYHQSSPGERFFESAYNQMMPSPKDSILDLGAGTGRAAKLFAEKGHKVTLVDIADNARDEDVLHMPFLKACLWEPFLVFANWGYCVDVMEHIPTEKVEAVLENISLRCDKCFFNIALFHDGYGQLIGETLHLTVKPEEWWAERMNEVFAEVEMPWNRDKTYARFICS